MFCDRCGTAVPASASQCPRCQAQLAAVAIVPATIPRGAGAWISDGWNAVTGNFWIFVLLGLIYCVGSSTFPILLQGPLALGLQWAALKQVCGSRAEPNDLGYGFNNFPAAVMVCLVTSIILGFATILLIIPGLIAAALLQLPYLFVIDRNLDFWSAIKASFDVSKRHFGSLLGLYLIQICLVIGGLLLCGVGILVAIPIMYTSSAAAYVEICGLRQETRAAMGGASRG